MADIEMAEGRRTSALFALREALRLHQQTAGSESWDAAVCQDKVAEWYLGEHRFAEAEAALWRVIRIKEKLLGPEDPELARHDRRLGELYVLQNKHPQADRMLAHAATLSLRGAGQRARQLTESLQMLAESQQAQVRPLLAERLRQLAERVDKGRLKADVRKDILETIQWLAAYLDRG